MAKLANSLREGAVWTLERLATFWTNVDTPKISADGVHAVGSVGWLQSQLHWFVGVAAVLGLLLAGGRMAWYRRGEPVQEALSGLFTLLVVTGCSVAVITIATEVSDQFSKWIISAAVGEETEFGGPLNRMLWADAGTMTAGLAIIVFVLVILASLAQIAMLYIRYAMLGLLVGFLPLAAGMTVVPEGKAWFKKLLGWLVAFLLYKPVAACIYAYAFIAVKAPDGTSQLVGIILIVMAVAALPALMRFVVPMVAATGGGSGTAMAATAAAGAMAGRAGSGGGPRGAAQVSSQEPTKTPTPPDKSDSPSGGQLPSGGQPGHKPGGEGTPPPGAQSTPSGGEQSPGGQPGTPGPTPTGGPKGGAPAPGGPGKGAPGAAVAGPAGVAAEAIRQGIKQGADKVKGAAEEATGEGGPSGAR